ncbi:MAG: hypothetical protein JWN12_546 [Candidatus Saccharibacteria bacterium]|nr:hypothetical protein [Candidatus Saccharibacteria bacterium]
MKKAKMTQNSDEKTARFSGRSSNRLVKIVLIIVLFLVVIGGIIALVVWRNAALPKTDTTSTTPAPVAATKVAKQSGQTLDPTIATSANAAKASGNVASAVAIYDTAIAANSDSDEQVALYISKAVLQASDGDVSGAITSAKKAEALAGLTLATTTLLASLYQQNGDKVNAAIYFRKAADLVVDPGDGSTVGDKQYYLDTAQQLEASQ